MSGKGIKYLCVGYDPEFSQQGSQSFAASHLQFQGAFQGLDRYDAGFYEQVADPLS
jgi:hypothetical protein